MRMINLIDKLPGRAYPARKADAIKHVVIHHAAAGTQDGDLPYYRKFIDSVDSYHRNKHKWRRIGYHYVIDPLGNCYKCNPYLTVTNHAKGGNTNGIGVMLIGNYELEPPSAAALATARQLVQELKAGIPSLESVRGHRDVPGSSTACPGKLMTAAMIKEMW